MTLGSMRELGVHHLIGLLADTSEKRTANFLFYALDAWQRPDPELISCSDFHEAGPQPQAAAGVAHIGLVVRLTFTFDDALIWRRSG
jgi:hypothetical protein